MNVNFLLSSPGSLFGYLEFLSNTGMDNTGGFRFDLVDNIIENLEIEEPRFGDATISIFRSQVQGEENQLYVYLNLENQEFNTTPFYLLTFTNQGDNIGISGTLRSCISSGLFLPSSPSETLPNLLGRIYLTQDEENICMVEYLVLEENKKDRYVFYCPSIEEVMLPCEKDTVAQKVSHLQNKGYVLSVPSLVSYSMLRLALSMLLFGKYNIKYLRRKYYEPFLCKLEKSVWSSFLAYFICDPGLIFSRGATSSSSKNCFSYYYKFFS